MRIAKPWYRKQDGNWYVQLDGHKIKLGPNEDVAHDEFDRLMKKRRSGAPLGNHTVRQVLAEYILWLKANRASTTVERRKPLLKAFGKAIPASLKIRELRGHHVLKWVGKMKYLKGKRRKGNPLAPTTINSRITAAQTFTNWAVKMVIYTTAGGKLVESKGQPFTQSIAVQVRRQERHTD